MKIPRFTLTEADLTRVPVSMKFPMLLALLAVCAYPVAKADHILDSNVASMELQTPSLSEAPVMKDVSLIPSLAAVNAEGMPSLPTTLNVSATTVPEYSVAGFIALSGYLLILRRRTN